jgi:hypothetical protein
MVVQNSRDVVTNLFSETTCDEFFAPDFAELQLRRGDRPQRVAGKRPRNIEPVLSLEKVGVYAPCIHGKQTMNSR